MFFSVNNCDKYFLMFLTEVFKSLLNVSRLHDMVLQTQIEYTHLFSDKIILFKSFIYFKSELFES